MEDPLEILDICSSLVRLSTAKLLDIDDDCSDLDTYVARLNAPRPVRQTVMLAHYSVKEYLISDRCVHGQASRYALIATVCHTSITETCLSTLLASHGNKLSFYSGKYWVEHARKTQGDLRWTQRAVELCLDSTALLRWSSSIYVTKLDSEFVPFFPAPSPPTCLYLMSLTGLAEVVAQLIDKHDQQVNGWGGVYGSPLQAASLKGHKAVVELLISRGANGNAVGGFYGDALRAAASEGHLEIVELLISAGADVNHDTVFYKPLYLHHLSLASAEACITRDDFSLWSVLQIAVRRGHSDIAELLIRHGARQDMSKEP